MRRQRAGSIPAHLQRQKEGRQQLMIRSEAGTPPVKKSLEGLPGTGSLLSSARSATLFKCMGIPSRPACADGRPQPNTVSAARIEIVFTVALPRLLRGEYPASISKAVGYRLKYLISRYLFVNPERVTDRRSGAGFQVSIAKVVAWLDEASRRRPPSVPRGSPQLPHLMTAVLGADSRWSAAMLTLEQ
jgi:hypothetical protein